MNEQDVIKIVQDEINRQRYQSGSPTILRHLHDGVDSPKISQTNIQNTVGVMGKLNFVSNDTYTLYFNSQNPSRIDINGFAFDTGSANSSVMIVGTALLSKAYYFQPALNHSVQEGGTAFPISGILAQCSANLYVKDGGTVPTTFPHTEQFYIINAYSNTGIHIATGQLVNLTPTSVNIVITNLLPGWNISVNFIIT